MDIYKFADFLGRTQVPVADPQTARHFKNKKILVTGAAGSIGSQLIRHLSSLEPAVLIAFDKSEAGLFDLQSAHTEKISPVIGVLGDVTDKVRLEAVFKRYRPDFVFHCAAYKHVPLLEDEVYEAVRNNVFGTRTIAQVSVRYRVDAFVLVSTDKAANPVSVMGATKLLAEQYILGLAARTGQTTRCVVTRFGNVLGSCGSVVPVFVKQISSGGPVTVTHCDASRYFMTVGEACELLVRSAVLDTSGKVVVFDMGNARKVLDLANHLIFHLRAGQEIKIIFTGLRAGEKLSEELIGSNELIRPTYHPRILEICSPAGNFEGLRLFIRALEEPLKRHDEPELKQLLWYFTRNWMPKPLVRRQVNLSGQR